MKFTCRPVGLDFIESAPLRFVRELEIDASPEDVFNVLADTATWPRFAKDILKGEWTSPEPRGVGSTRTVFLRGMTVWEKFIAWEPGKRFTFYITQSNVPLVRALCEDYRLEPTGSEKTRFTYIMACDPTFLLKVMGPAGRWFLGGICSRLAHGLAAFLEEKQFAQGR